jgi:hypothetical protein
MTTPSRCSWARGTAVDSSLAADMMLVAEDLPY